MNNKLMMSALILIMTATAATSCRSPRRGVRVGADAARLDITMIGIAPEDSGKANWIYELSGYGSGCVTPINGELGKDNIVSFTAIGLKAGLENCQLRVKSVQPSASIKFVEGSEPNVLYWARSLVISQDAAGQLISNASLQKLFEVVTPADARKTFSLKIPVKFSKPEPETVITAAILCTPETANIGKYNKTDDSNGEIVFTLPIEEADVAYACTDLFINVGGVPLKFKGSFIGDNGKFTGSADKVVALQPLDVLFQSPNNPDPNKDNVSVSTTKGEECNVEGKIFDVATGECKAKP